MIMGQPDYFL